MINNIVIIHIDTFKREFFSSWILSQKLKKAGFNVILTSRHSTRRLLKIFSPNIFIATHSFTIDNRLLESLNNRGTKLFIHEAEATNVNHTVSLSYPKIDNNNQKFNYNLFSGFFLWNNFTFNWLEKNKNIKKEKLHVVGSIRKSKYCKISKSDMSKFTVGFLSRFELINTYDKRHHFQNLMTIDPEEENYLWYFERLSIDSEVFSIYFKLIKKLIMGGYYVSIRPHPNEDPQAYKKLIDYFGPLFSVDTSYSINEWLNKVNVVFGTTSSAFAEAYLLKIPIISSSKIQNFNYKINRDYVDMNDKFDQAAYMPNSISEAFNMCINKNLQPKKINELENYLDDFYSIKIKIDPIDNIVKILSSNKKEIKLLGYLYYLSQYLFVLVLDLLIIFKYIIFLRSFSKFKILRNYNYNRLLHKFPKSQKHHLISILKNEI